MERNVQRLVLSAIQKFIQTETGENKEKFIILDLKQDHILSCLQSIISKGLFFC